MKIAIATISALLVLAGSAGAATIKTQSVSNGGPHGIAAASDGASVFLGARDCGYVGRFDLASRTFSRTLADPPLPCTPDGDNQGRGPFSIVQGLDGKLYFTLYDDGPIDGIGSIARVNVDGSGFESVNVGTHPLDVTIGPDGKIWFTVNGPPGMVGRVDPANFAGAQTWALPAGRPRGIVAGPDANLYVMGGESDNLYKVTADANPVITEVDSGMDGPGFGEVGPDGRIWFTLFEGEGVRTWNPTAGGGQTIPLSGRAWDVAFGEDGKAYATLYDDNKIAQIDRGVSGDLGQVVVTPLPLSTTSGVPAFIATSPSGNLFAAGKGENTIFEVVPDVPPRVTTGLTTALVSNSATVAASVNPRASATNVRILFGTSPAFGQQTPDTSLGATDDPQAVGFSLSGLQPETTYHYRAEASNKYGTTVGATRTFTTAQAPDSDGDGARPPADCDDTKASVRPGVKEVTDDGIDQDCSGADLRSVRSTVRNQWRASRRATRVVTLTARSVPAGATIEVRCSGGSKRRCPFSKKTRRVTKATASVKLASLFSKRALRPKARVEVRILVPGLVGKVVTFTVRASRIPSVRTRCLAPGATAPSACS